MSRKRSRHNKKAKKESPGTCTVAEKTKVADDGADDINIDGDVLAITVDGNDAIEVVDQVPSRNTYFLEKRSTPSTTPATTDLAKEKADKKNVFPSVAMLKQAVEECTIAGVVYLQYDASFSSYLKVKRSLVDGVLQMMEKRCNHSSVKTYIDNGWFSGAELFGVEMLIQHYRNS